MLNTLHAIATDEYRKADHQIYEALPESNSSRMSDCLITKARVLDAKVTEPFVADLVVDQILSERLSATPGRNGKIVELGDLPADHRRAVVDASNSLIIPGQLTLVPDWKPKTQLAESQIAELLARGTTTALGVVDLLDRDAIESASSPQSLPFNWGFLANADGLAKLQPMEAIEHLSHASTSGILGIVTSGIDEEIWRSIHLFGLPLIPMSQFSQPNESTYLDLAATPWKLASALKLQANRARINRDYFADLLFFDAANPKTSETVDWKKLSRLMVAGESVWENGKRLGGSPGTLLRRG
jgi:hypothetical protein